MRFQPSSSAFAAFIMVLERSIASSSACTSAAAAISSVSADNESDGMHQKERGVMDPTSVAFLTHDKSLRSVLERFGEENVLKGWSEEDCAGLLVQLLENFCDFGGAARIVRSFRDTSIDEIVECFDLCKDLNQRASKERVRMEDCVHPSPLPEENVPFPNWSSVLAQAKKSRGIPDFSSAAIAKLLTEMSDRCEDEKNAAFNAPNYKFIYNHLASLVLGYSMRDVRSIDAAVILEIFEGMENVIRSMPGLRAFFNQMHRDVQRFPNDEFKLGEEISDKNSGKLLTNILEIPDDLFDLSTVYDDNPDKT